MSNVLRHHIWRGKHKANFLFAVSGASTKPALPIGFGTSHGVLLRMVVTTVGNRRGPGPISYVISNAFMFPQAQSRLNSSPKKGTEKSASCSTRHVSFAKGA